MTRGEKIQTVPRSPLKGHRARQSDHRGVVRAAGEIRQVSAEPRFGGQRVHAFTEFSVRRHAAADHHIANVVFDGGANQLLRKDPRGCFLKRGAQIGSSLFRLGNTVIANVGGDLRF